MIGYSCLFFMVPPFIDEVQKLFEYELQNQNREIEQNTLFCNEYGNNSFYMQKKKTERKNKKIQIRL